MPPKTPIAKPYSGLANPPVTLGSQLLSRVSPIAPVTPTQPKLNVTKPVPSTALTTPSTPTDVFKTRSAYETNLANIKSQAEKIKGMLDTMQASNASGVTPTPLSNPDSWLSKYYDTGLGQSDTQKTQQGYLDRIAETTKNFFTTRQDNIDQINKNAGLPGLRDALAETNQKLADRRVQLRNDLKALETDSAERAVPRAFAEQRKRQIESEAAFDMANLAIVQSAQAGNLEQARADAKDLIKQQFDSYEQEIAVYEADLKRLEPTLNAEQKKEALMVQTALDERKRMLAAAKDDQDMKYKAFIEAASSGAPSSVTDRIMQAGSGAEAYTIAGPYIGLLDRQKEARIAAGDTGGGFKSGSFSATDENVGEVVKALESRRGSDGYTDSGVYLSFLNQFTTQGGLAPDFLKKFPPDIYLNPNDESIPQYIRRSLDTIDSFNLY